MGTKPNNTSAGRAPAPPAPPKPRKRAKISAERRFALLLGALVAFCDENNLKGTPVEAGRAAAREMTDKVITPIVERLKALRAELAGFNMATVAMDKLKAVTSEIAKLEARLKVTNEQAQGKVTNEQAQGK